MLCFSWLKAGIVFSFNKLLFTIKSLKMKNDNRNRHQNSDRCDNERDSRWNNYSEYNDYNDYENGKSLPNDFQRRSYDGSYGRFNDSYPNNRMNSGNNLYRSEQNRPYRNGGQDDYRENDSRKQNYRNDYPLNNDFRGNINRNNDEGNQRTWWDKTSDEVSSWFGDDDAQRRREMDDIRDYNHRGKGPKNYKRSPERIKDDVNDKLSDHWMIDASEIEVEVKDSEVTLNGTVDSRQSKRKAEDVAESVSGVTHVQNNLRVNAPSGNYKKTTDNESSISNTAYPNGARKKESMSHN